MRNMLIFTKPLPHVSNSCRVRVLKTILTASIVLKCLAAALHPSFCRFWSSNFKKYIFSVTNLETKVNPIYILKKQLSNYARHCCFKSNQLSYVVRLDRKIAKNAWQVIWPIMNLFEIAKGIKKFRLDNRQCKKTFWTHICTVKTFGQ